MHRGWIKLYRKSVDNPMYFAEPFTKWQAWQDMILIANHEKKLLVIKGHKITAERGQLAYSMESLGKRWKWKRDKVRRYLTHLVTTQQIIQRNMYVTTLITIINYDKYMSDSPTESPKSSPTDTTQTRSKEVKNKEKEYMVLFDKFWIVYPRKKAKQDAKSAWLKLAPDEELFASIMSNLERQIKSEDWTKDKGKFIPYPATWIRGKRWEDDVEIKDEWDTVRDI